MEKEFFHEKIPEMSEIQELKTRLEKLEKILEKEKTPTEKEQIIKKEISAYLKEIQTLPSFAPPTSVRDEAKEIAKFPSSQQVGALVSLVFEKGLRQAISVAKALNNPAILDEFHDILIDRYYQILLEKKIIKNL